MLYTPLSICSQTLPFTSSLIGISYLCIANTSDLDTETLATLYSIFQKAPATATSINYKDFAEIVDPNTPFQWSLSSDAIDNEMISRIKKAKSIGLKTITGDEEEQPAAPAETKAEPVAPAAPVEEPSVETPAEAPVKETPAEAPVKETPAEAPVKETPAEETPAEETPAEETPVEETPAEETPVEETPAEETPAEETPVEETPVEETPVEETPASVEETIAIDDELVDPDKITDEEPAAEIKKEKPVELPIKQPKTEELVTVEQPAPVEEPTTQEPIPENLKHNEEEEDKPEPKKPRQPIRFQLPEGFGKPTSAAIWNTPVITDFGYPFLNFSSEAIQHLFKTKDLDDKKRTFKNIKKMLKVAKKRYGGIWKAI